MTPSTQSKINISITCKVSWCPLALFFPEPFKITQSATEQCCSLCVTLQSLSLEEPIHSLCLFFGMQVHLSFYSYLFFFFLNKAPPSGGSSEILFCLLLIPSLQFTMTKMLLRTLAE